MPGLGSIFVKDISGNTIQLSTSGAILSNQSPYPSYNVYAPNVQVMAGTSGHQFVMMMSSGASVVKVRSLFVSPTPENANISGGPIKYDICRIVNASGGGSGLSAIALDPRDPTSAVNLLIQTNSASGASISGVLDSFTLNTLALPTLVSGQTKTQDNYDSLYVAQQTNLISTSPVGEEKPIVLTSGWGLSIHQTTGASYTTLASGSFNITVTYSVEPS